ncbi:MFS transporter [Leuconostoc gelidum]|uniref:MFS transporter n=1 Tax=Leuconostoc gelidum TaxID=1244 RepID=UPI00027E6435|nr:MFS transporter [Leuconostoc gelidum]AFS40446.1 multidrug transporter [Leuconostoc gelidum JB7]GMA68199.1 MFS transporter [Leuconostoc gelidum subsp. gelidum]
MTNENKKLITRNFIMLAILLATFMTSVETTIIMTGLPTIVSQLHGISLQSWIFATYLLLTALTTPIYGKFADRIGRKPVFLTGLILFSTGSLLCGLSNNIIMLVLFRALQGMGAGAIMPITFTMIADLFDYQKRSTMLALNNTAWGVSALLGPLLGGYIVDKLNWHWVFFINVPIGILVIVIISLKYKEEKKVPEKKPIDFKGIFSLSGFLVSLLILFQILGNSEISLIKTTIIVGLTFIFGFFFWKVETKVYDPIIPLSLLHNSLFSIQVTTALLLSAIQIGFQTYFPMWLQAIYKSTATVAGLSVTLSPVFWLISSFFVGKIVKRWAPKYVAICLIVIMAIAYLPLIFVDSNVTKNIFFIISAVSGITLGIVITMNTLIAQRVVPEESLGTASAMITLGRTLGQTLAAGIFGLAFNVSLNSGIKKYNFINRNLINQSISGTHHLDVIVHRDALNEVILTSMHTVFGMVLLLFAIVLLINVLDKNKSVVK